MAVLSSIEYIAANLPKNAKFAKPGYAVVDTPTAIQDALDTTANSLGAPVKEKALAFLYRQLAATYPFQQFSASDVSYTKPQLLELADYWEELAPPDPNMPEIAQEGGGFTNIPAVDRSWGCGGWNGCNDQNSHCQNWGE